MFGSRTESIWTPSQLSLCTHSPTAHSSAISRFACNFFPKWPLIFGQHTVHPVIWPSPGTLVQCDVWRVTCDVWSVTCDVWRVTCDVWRVTCDVWLLLQLVLVKSNSVLLQLVLVKSYSCVCLLQLVWVKRYTHLLIKTSYSVSTSPHPIAQKLRLTVVVFSRTWELTALRFKSFGLYLHRDTLWDAVITPCTAPVQNWWRWCSPRTKVRCSVLQCVAACCSVLQCALYSPRTKLLEMMLLWVVTATKTWTGIYSAGIASTQASPSLHQRHDSLAFTWATTQLEYRVAWSRRMPYLHRSFSAKEPDN